MTKIVSPDRSKIAIEHDDELRHWVKHFDVPEEALRKAIDKVGNSAAAVRKELRIGKDQSPHGD